MRSATRCMLNSVLTDLNLEDNEIGVEGAKAIADALRVNGALTEVGAFLNLAPWRVGLACFSLSPPLCIRAQVDLRANATGEEAKAALREIAEGRPSLAGLALKL